MVDDVTRNTWKRRYKNTQGWGEAYLRTEAQETELMIMITVTSMIT
jgi:hypothetical protein